MGLKAFQLTTTAARQRLSDVYGGAAGVIDAKTDIPYRQILLQAQTADVAVGDVTVTTTIYGVLVPFTGAPVITIGPFDTGPVKLSDLYAIGTTGVLHITGIPY